MSSHLYHAALAKGMTSSCSSEAAVSFEKLYNNALEVSHLHHDKGR
jgi:hypothetical protein